MASGDVYAVKLGITFAGQECRPGFYLIEGTTSHGPNPCQDVSAAVATALGSTPLAGFATPTVLHSIIVSDIQPRVSATFERNLNPTFSGTIADDNPPPPQDSMLIRWLTNLKRGKGTKATHGRTYMPGIYSTGQISGFLIQDLQDALSAFASLLFDPFVSDGSEYAMAAIHFTPNSHPRTIDAFNLITDFSIDNVVDVQRRRRPGRGI